jgi:hypothetical protein
MNDVCIYVQAICSNRDKHNHRIRGYREVIEMDDWHETSVLFLVLFNVMISANVDECRDTLVGRE